MQLIEYIREYNDDAEEEQLNFYGFDMQRIRYSFDAWNQNYSYEEKKDLLMEAY